MSVYNDFLQSLLPGNYALTKSMELTKVNDAGTLWYTKKFLTLYYFVFLSNDIMTKSYQKAVVEIFDNYIESLPEGVRESARLYFYPENEAINFKSDKFNLFSNFAGYNAFATQEERKAYYQSAKKYYFSLLMGSGGQTGLKKKLKESVQRPEFVYSHDSIAEIILRSAIEVCVHEVNTKQAVSDNSIKYILSDETIKRACEMAAQNSIDEACVIQLNRDYPHNNPNFRGIENDMIAFIRNERQILYYYGYFHSKSTGAADFEFSSLTPIGELALYANANEFLAIWEHQKIKMISQPPTADINQIPAVDNSSENFGISYTPYTDILGHLMRRGSLSLDEYKYVVSRKKHTFNKEDWEKDEEKIMSNLENIRAYVNAFGRKRDKADEDGRKELLKYLLGIRSDLPNDRGCHSLNILKFRNSNIIVENRDMLALIYDIYSKMDSYKILKYESVFTDSENDLRRRYMETVRGERSKVNSRIKIYWDLYNIHPDNFIMMCSAIVISAISLGINDIENMSREDTDAVSLYIFENFNKIFKTLGMRTSAAVKREVQKAVFAIKNGDYSNYIRVDKEHEEQILAKYKAESKGDLLTKIKQISVKAVVTPAENRSRNSTLVSLLKSYYMSCYAENSMLKCECCGEETFITNAGEPYVEFHHLIPFNIAYGPDHYLNLFALCPNCHRKLHFLSTENKREKYEELNSNNYMSLCFSERLCELRKKNLLRSYHLEFLLADNAITIDEYNKIAV